MLGVADAALLIGDPALRVDVCRGGAPYSRSGRRVGSHDRPADGVCRLGGPQGVVTPEVTEAFRESCRYGRDRIDEMVACEAILRGFPPDLVREYLKVRIVHELGPRDYEGMDLFLRYASAGRSEPKGSKPRFDGRPRPVPYTESSQLEITTMLYIAILTIHILVCIFLIIVVLLQSGKAADLAGAFGGMGSQTAFGPRGSATLLSKATTVSAVVFMLTSLSLSILATRERRAWRPRFWTIVGRRADGSGEVAHSSEGANHSTARRQAGATAVADPAARPAGAGPTEEVAPPAEVAELADALA